MKNEVENLLRRRGYQILGKNQKESILVNVDGQDHLSSLEAEYTVERSGKKFVVVVKRGEGSFDPTEPGFRRKLIEYARAFGLNGILLVDPEAEEIHTVSFKFPRERGLDFYFQFFSALFIIAIVVGIIYLMVQVKLF
ncbi:hypothetical protein A2625_05305 [candidate division WOR-1 bacterium RIFCSPHIGHO2_01_FULL_53_15]|uniref:Uncharacterized protein n=1 Tax=candidate division WOR-1 bacterium RIFCSPHIGHO2_01_FULL_53_15 TaxID=1802564 RepID=A0A1F4Q1V3_UNCSA|nr:MAG: hypothetical protein A2625_05305 [candidate division WOR-1 bacterium RIFCSPHIGHO2_01_FULL_53_15]OGC13087.1 MAG: hypothetical protein A3D23_00250 [candidate division WOR-1 bacterium RIFCSPHIGHO2_02_FULL_53_26]